MNASPIPFLCIVTTLALACGSDTKEPTGPKVLVAMPPADASYDDLLGLAGEGCLVEAAPANTTGGAGETADAGASSETGDDRASVQASQPLVIRHRLDAALVARQQALTPEVILETVCDRKVLDDVAYREDGQLIKPTVALRGAECGLIVTLRVAELETRCEIPADPMTCDASATPCEGEAASSSGSGDAAGSSSAGETGGDTTMATTGTNG